MAKMHLFRPIKKRQAHSAQALVEFSLTILVFLLALVLIIEMARIMHAFITVQHAARMGARYAVTGEWYDEYSDTDPNDIAQRGAGWDSTSATPLHRILPCQPIMHRAGTGGTGPTPVSLADPLVTGMNFGSGWTPTSPWNATLYSMYLNENSIESAYGTYQPYRSARTCSVEENVIRAMTGLTLNVNAPGEVYPDDSSIPANLRGRPFPGFYEVRVLGTPVDSSPQLSQELVRMSGGNEVYLADYYGDPRFQGQEGGICLGDNGLPYPTQPSVSSNDPEQDCLDLDSDNSYVDYNDSQVEGFAGLPEDYVYVTVRYNLPIITPLVSNIAPSIRVDGSATLRNEPFGNTGLQRQAQIPEAPETIPTPLPPLPESDLAVTLALAAPYTDTVQKGTQFQYLVIVTNLGQSTANQALLTLELGTGVNVVTGSLPAECSGSGSAVTCDRTTPLLDEEIWTLNITATAPTGSAGTDIVVVAEASVAVLGGSTDPSPTNDTNNRSVTFIDAPVVNPGATPTPNGAPLLIAPGDEIDTFLTPFTWTEVNGAEWYLFWLGYYDGSGYPSGNQRRLYTEWMQVGDTVNCSAGICEAIPSFSLQRDVDYVWYIRAWTSNTDAVFWEDGSGYGPFSQGKYFTINVPPLTAPILTSPIANVTITEARPTFTWDRVSTATWYYLWINRGGNVIYRQWYRSTDVCSGGTCQVRPTYTTPLLNGGYTWWVQAWNSGEPQGRWSKPGNFNLNAPPPTPPPLPDAAILIAPDGVINTGRPLFQWNAANNAEWYRIYVADLQTNAPVLDQWYLGAAVCQLNGTCSVNYSGANSLPAGDYRWWIRTWNPTGFGDWSDYLDFETNVPANPNAPASPALISPISGGTPLIIGDTNFATYGSAVDRPNFTWNNVTNADWYQVYATGSTSGAVLNQFYQVNSTVICTTTCQITGPVSLANDTYQWWVRGYSERYGYGAWSVPASFEIASAAAGLAKPVFSSPSAPPVYDGTTDNNPHTFAWSNVANATHYRLTENDTVYDPGLPALLVPGTDVTCTGATCTLNTTLTLPTGVHEWRVQALRDANADGDFLDPDDQESPLSDILEITIGPGSGGSYAAFLNTGPESNALCDNPVTYAGRTWEPDRIYNAGSAPYGRVTPGDNSNTSTTNRSITESGALLAAPDPRSLFQCMREGTGGSNGQVRFTYRFDIPATAPTGIYRIVMGFAEWEKSGTNQRRFSVDTYVQSGVTDRLNLLNNIDVLAEAGGRDRVIFRYGTVNVTVVPNSIFIDFEKGTVDNPMIQLLGVESTN